MTLSRRLFGLSICVGIALIASGAVTAEAVPLDPRDFAPLADVSPDYDYYTIDTTAGTWSDSLGDVLYHGVVTSDNVLVFTFGSMALTSGMRISAIGSRPLALLSHGDVTISSGGLIDVSGSSATHNDPFSPGIGGAGGGGGDVGLGHGSFGSGGSFGGPGGNSYVVPFENLATSFGGGGPYGNLAVALVGGSGGGSGGSESGMTSGGGGGGGGGAIEISAIGSLQIGGNGINANGGFGGSVSSAGGPIGGGGGSGGGILLSGNGITITAPLSAQGGGAGSGSSSNFLSSGGGGGGGRVLILTRPGSSITGLGYVNVLGGSDAFGNPSGGAGEFRYGVIPEPSSWFLMTVGAVSLAASRFRSHHKS